MYILSYNLWYKALSKKNNRENISKFINSLSYPLDFICFQETNYMKKFIELTPILNKLYFVKHPTNYMYTFFRKMPLCGYVGNFDTNVDSGRCFIVLEYPEYYLINVHVGHKYNTDKFISGRLNKYIKDDGKRLIMCGDFNRDRGNRSFIFEYKNGNKKKLYNTNNVLPTCCSPLTTPEDKTNCGNIKERFDNIYDSGSKTNERKTYCWKRNIGYIRNDNLILASDHLPIIGIIK